MITVPFLAEVIGPDIFIILLIAALLFGSSRLPKLARSLGSAKAEFEKGIAEGTGSAERSLARPADEHVTLTKAELDAMIAEREARGRAASGRTSPVPPAPSGSDPSA